MIQTITAIKSRMNSVTNIRKITRAMEMVSMSKLNRVRSSLFAMRNYFGYLESILNDFFAHAGHISHPLLEKRPASGRIGVCVITSDTGLCSTYNQAIIRTAEAFMTKFKKEDILTIFADPKIIIAVEKKNVESFFNKIITNFQEREQYEVCSELKNRFDIWRERKKRGRPKTKGKEA